MWEGCKPQDLIKFIRTGTMPEIHCWVVLPDRREIVDITTCYLVNRCKDELGMTWPGHKPPNFLWCKPEEFPDGVAYTPHTDAIDFAAQAIRNLTRQDGITVYRMKGE